MPSVTPAAEISLYLPGQSSLTHDTYFYSIEKMLGGDGDDIFYDSADDGGSGCDGKFNALALAV